MAREEEVEGREDRLLDLARVFGPADEHEAAREVEQDENVGAGAVALGVGLERAGVDDGEAARGIAREHRRVVLGVLPARLDEHVGRELRVPRLLGDDADGQAVARVGPGDGVDGEQLAGAEVVEYAGEERVEVRFVDGAVDLAPADLGLGARLADDEAVLGRASGVGAGRGVEHAVVGQLALAALDRVARECGSVEVVVERRFGVEAEGAQVGEDSVWTGHRGSGGKADNEWTRRRRGRCEGWKRFRKR